MSKNIAALKYVIQHGWHEVLYLSINSWRVFDNRSTSFGNETNCMWFQCFQVQKSYSVNILRLKMLNDVATWGFQWTWAIHNPWGIKRLTTTLTCKMWGYMQCIQMDDDEITFLCIWKNAHWSKLQTKSDTKLLVGTFAQPYGHSNKNAHTLWCTSAACGDCCYFNRL